MLRLNCSRPARKVFERGQAATEFVILVPTLIITLAALVLVFIRAYAQLATTTAAYDCNMLALQQSTRAHSWAEQRGNAALVYARSSHLLSGWVTREMQVMWAAGCTVGIDGDGIPGLSDEESTRYTSGTVELYRSCWDDAPAIVPAEAASGSDPADPYGRTCNFEALPSDVR